jgi:hypothetical protein
MQISTIGFQKADARGIPTVPAPKMFSGSAAADRQRVQTDGADIMQEQDC